MNIAVKGILIIIGSLSIILGVIGIVVPLLPTTPLILLGAACYVKASDELYQKLIRNKWLGGYIRDFREKNGITLKNKILSISLMWISITATLLIVDFHFWLAAVLIIIAVTVSAYILSFDTL
ncbi:YbaN family protein [Bacillus sp. ISL-35]|uniref:YbaN family protein n=1 Tax=Bacillus sp. ISL-35 TaxID=2819122 RepID=UPI001BEBD4FF|nr:YbaN family protein [Bacillus sp. ISL-35]MBT2680950.1 YbaN family protein [Bacillus sp. ISL-35]MBT2705267.1 YbaN family protein [Chryseobacterium sp. ISL-80]